MQYYTILSILAGAAAVSAAGITDEILGSSLTGTASGSGDAQAKGALTGLPTDDLLKGGLTGDAKGSADGSADASDAAAPKGPFSKGGLLDNLKMKELLNPTAYPYEDPVTTSAYQAIPTATFITRTVTATATETERHIPTVTVRPPPPPFDPPTNPGTVTGVSSCSEGTSTSCCDTSAASDGLLSNILGGSCALSNLNIPVLAVGGLSGSQCNNGNTFCCPVNQDGNLNIALACIPLNL